MAQSTPKYMWVAFIILFGVICARSATTAAGNISPALSRIIADSDRSQPIKVWIYFTDKDESSEAFAKAAISLTPQSLARRRHVPIDRYDLPVSHDHVQIIQQAGLIDIRVSRWLNAVSAYATPDQIERLAGERFIRRIDPVARLVRRPEPDVLDKALMPNLDSAAYGISYAQNHMLGVDSLHRAGVTGEGILLAFFDTGYLTTHPVFDSMNILDTWNFINNTSIVNDEINLHQTEHGTATLSTCGGFSEDNSIGPAYGADYILAKTEYLNQEIQIEEDFWVLAAEWADSLGADIISSSLGYINWYTYADLDGNTAVTTIAADIAASRGILVVVSAGNEGNDPWHYIDAPADGDSVVSVGAVNVGRTIASFSSYGPTADGRLKPEVSAMGVGVYCASDHGGYFFKSGTSLSAPLIAGGAAMILQANPAMRGHPMDIRQRLILAADRYTHPDNHYGNGIPNLIAAAGYGVLIHDIPPVTIWPGQDTTLQFIAVGPYGEPIVWEALSIPYAGVFDGYPDGTATVNFVAENGDVGEKNYSIVASSDGYADTLFFTVNTFPSTQVLTVGPNPCHDELNILVSGDFPGGYKIEIFSLNGDLVYRAFPQEARFIWDTTNESGENVASGLYIIRFSADGVEEKTKIFKL